MSNGLNAFALVIGVSCSKDNEEDCCPCPELPTAPGNIFITTYAEIGEQFTMPAYNPNNDDEFVYAYRNNIADEYNFRVHNKRTGETRVILENVSAVGQIKWSRQD